MNYDVIIIGGGPAGLSAALVLGRCRRRVVVFDDDQPRNAAAQHMHGYLTRDGVPPRELLRIGREEIARYGVEFVPQRVASACCCRPSCGPATGQQQTAFQVVLEDGRTFRSRKMLLATGVRDQLPGIPGVRTFYGKGVYHCPYCDGYEHRDDRMIAFGDGKAAVGLGLSLRTWSDHVTVCTHGTALEQSQRDRLRRGGIALREEPIAALEGNDRLERAVFQQGPPLECQAFFFNTDQTQRSSLPAMLGCDYDDRGNIVTQGKQHTCVSGLYLAGDADGDVQFVIVAAAEGATAATAINRDLQDEDHAEAEPIPDAWRFTDAAAAASDADGPG